MRRARGHRGRADRGRDGSNNRPPHPKGLKGKEIGLYYAKLSKEKKGNKKALGTVIVPEVNITEIQEALSSSSVKSFFAHSDNYNNIEDSHFKQDFLRLINESIEEKLSKFTVQLLQDPLLDDSIYEEHVKNTQKSSIYRDMLRNRKKLPSFEMKDRLLELIEQNQIVVISGETGCGKTTQVGQFILDEYIEKRKGSTCHVLCTQPRRISAVAVAERVAHERGEQLGHSVGYQIRLEQKKPRRRGSILFCTTGIVLKKMETDPALSEVSHLILDEIHERDVLSDFILALIKQVITKRTDLKIILMSATLNSEKFSKYYNNAPHINIPGFTYPVQEFYLEDVIERTRFAFDYGEPKKPAWVMHKNKKAKEQKEHEYDNLIRPYVRQLSAERKYSSFTLGQLQDSRCEIFNLDLINVLILNICEYDQNKEGAILVFLTGFVEISELIQKMERTGKFPSHKYHIYALHSLMPTVDQKQIFERPPKGVRKIIISTSIAETSITIDDVVFVIDCGRIKTSNFDAETNSESLRPGWVSLANAKQRRGRAGRVQSGICFHLYTKPREMDFDQYQKPEILRKRLEDVILTAKVLQLGRIERFFSTLIDAPDPKAVTLALDLLKRLEALDKNENLTPLGYHLAKLPMAPQMGKMILFAAIFSCLDPILSIATTLDFKDAFQLPIGKEKEVNERKMSLADECSDHLLYHEVMKAYDKHKYGNLRQFCWNHFLSSNTLKLLNDMKKQFTGYLRDMNFVDDTDPKSAKFNENSHNMSLVKAIVCAGLYPNVLIVKNPRKRIVMCPEGNTVKIHPKSILSNDKLYFDSKLIVYYRKVKSTDDFIHDGSLIHPLPVIFFGDNFRNEMDGGYEMIFISDKLKFKSNKATVSVIEDLRNRFNWFLRYKISHPGPVVWGAENDETKILQLISDLITSEDLGTLDDDYADEEH